MSNCESLVSYLGSVGTYSYFASRQKFGTTVSYVPVRGIDNVFKDVDEGRSNYGIVPVENSMDGGIRETLNMFVQCDVKVCGEIVLPVHHNLMVKDANEDIKVIYSKLQVFGQCREWLSCNFSDAELVDVASSAEAGNIVKDKTNAAAIAHVEVAGLCGLTIISRDIEDNPDNITRFFVLSNEYPSPSGSDKTIAMCYLKNRVGGLYDLLRPFKDYGINLTYIEAHPTKKNVWDYGFYLDFEGHVDDEHVKKAIDEVAGNCVEINIVGSFAKCMGN